MTALDGLPLALDQVGAYIEETHSSLAHYLNLMAQAVRNSYAAVEDFQLTTRIRRYYLVDLLQKVEHESMAAADLLFLLAFLDPEAIPEEIILKGAPELGRCA